jgi:Holliday junction resolvase RusA-like endonuclease
MTPITFRVNGIPQPQGSKTAFVRNGRAVLVEGRRGPARENFKTWREAVQRGAAEHCMGEPIAGPLHVTAVFVMPKPKSAKKNATRPVTRPDVDKLARTVLDALTQSGLIVDDSHIARLHVEKTYATERDPCGVLVSISRLDERAAP